MEEIKEENRSELVDILDSYFDPDKEAIVPPSKSNQNRRRSYRKAGSPRDRRSRKGENNNDKKHVGENNNNNEIQTTPESSTRSPRRNRRSRRQLNRSGKQLNRSLTDATPDTEASTMSPVVKATAAEITVA